VHITVAVVDEVADHKNHGPFVSGRPYEVRLREFECTGDQSFNLTPTIAKTAGTFSARCAGILVRMQISDLTLTDYHVSFVKKRHVHSRS
jgi:hypothetical protein